MGGKTSTSSSSGGNNNNNNNNNQANQIANQVKKDIGFSQTKHPTEGIVNTYAFKDGKKNEMYGGQASTAAKKRMAEAGLGTYNENNDSFQNVVGNQIISSTGMMGTSMGSGENTIMGQIPISEKMFESQRRIQMIATGAMAAVGAPLMGAAFMDYNRKRYSDYITSFNSALGSTSSSTSYAAKSNTDTSDARIQDTKAQAESNESSKEAAQQALLRKQAIARNQAALKGKRTFFSGSKKLIKGEMQ
tara:strand:- start:12 stop:752 length:741 start_codon:yes stop_codon:yes gene_type:complete